MQSVLVETHVARAAMIELSRRWWLPFLSGIAWLILAWVLLSFDVTTVWTVAVFTGLYLIYGGIAQLAIAFAATSWRWLWGLVGIALIAGGVVALTWPDITFLALAATISWVIMFSGIADVTTAILLREIDDLWWLTLIVGFAQIAIGFWAIGYEGRSIVLLVVWLAATAASRGIVHIVLALQLRKLRGLADTPDPGGLRPAAA